MAGNPTGPARFLTKFKNWFSVVMHPQKVVAHPNGLVQVTPGKRIDFVHGEYITSDPEEIAFLRARIADPKGADFVEDTSYKPARREQTPEQMNKADLTAYATAKGVIVTEEMTKKEILEALADLEA